MALRPLTEAEKLDIEVGKMMRRVAANPKTRRQVYQTLKQADPSVRWPDQDIEDFKEEWLKKQDEERIARKAAEDKAEMEKQRATFLERYGEEDLKKIEKLMEKHAIFDYEVAAKLYAAEAPPPTQGNEAYGSAGSTRWEMPSDKELLDNPTKWADKMARQTIAEFRQQRGLPGR